MFRILPNAQTKLKTATDIYLEEEIIDFSGQLSTGINLAINFNLA